MSSEFCKTEFDGLGVRCERCGSWRRGFEVPDCPPYITRSEPDGARLPHITTAAQNTKARTDWLLTMDPEWHT